MPEDMKMKMARLRAMKKPKKGGAPSSAFTNMIFGENKPLPPTKAKPTQRQDSPFERAVGLTTGGQNTFLRSEWDTMLPVISIANPAFGTFLRKMLVLDDFDKGKISTKDLAKVAAREGFNTWVQPKIVGALKAAAKKHLGVGGGKKMKVKDPPRGKRGKGKIADGIRKFLDPFDLGKRLGSLDEKKLSNLITVVKAIDPKVGKFMSLLQKGRQFLSDDDLPEGLTIEDVTETIERSLEEYNDLFDDETGFPDSLAEPNAARRGDKESKGKAGFGQNGLAGNPSTNPKPKEYVIPVKPVNSSTSKGAPRGAMSGFKAIGRSPNASSFATVSF